MATWRGETVECSGVNLGVPSPLWCMTETLIVKHWEKYLKTHIIRHAVEAGLVKAVLVPPGRERRRRINVHFTAGPNPGQAGFLARLSGEITP